MAEIKDLNTTDASNTGTAANAGFPENMAYSDVNNAARALEGMIARWYADTNSTLDTAGSSNAYTLTPNRTVAAYARGDTYTVEASFTNTGAATINVSSLGAKSIVKPSGSAVVSGDIQSGGIYTLVFDGTNFQMAGVDDPTTLSITTLTVSGVTTLNGNTVIGSDASDTVTINADVASNVLPSADNTYDLGASGSEWKDLYIDGIAYVDTLNADSVDIDGGSIDGTTIGGSSAAAGTFTTISGTTITASTSLKTPLIEYTDGDDAITIADGGGVTIADLTATSIDVNGGTIDGAVIGGTTPAAGSFTTFTSTGIDDNASSNAMTIDSSQNTTFAGQVIAPNGATSGYYLKQVGGTGTPRVTNDGNNWTIIRPGASGSDVAINNYANSANLVVFTDEGKAGIGTASPTGLPLHLKVSSGDNKLQMQTANKNAYVMEFEDSTGNLKLGTNTLAGSFVLRDDGNVGIGSGGMACYSAYRQLSVGAMAHIMGTTASSTTGSLHISQNAHFETDGTWETMETDKSSNYYQYAGGHYWRGSDTAASAGTDITWSENMVFNHFGQLLVGKTTDSNSDTGGMLTSQGPIYSSMNGSVYNTYHYYDTNSSAYKFYIGGNGQVFASTNTIGVISDARLKENIRDYTVGLDDILKLQPRQWDWKENEGKNIKNDVGFVAQEFEEVFPNWVGTFLHDDLDDAKSVGAGDIIFPMVNAIKTLNAEIESLKSKVKALEEA